MTLLKRKQRRYKDNLSDREFVDWFISWARRDFEKSKEECWAIHNEECATYCQDCKNKKLERISELKDQINEAAKTFKIKVNKDRETLRISDKDFDDSNLY